MSTKKVELQEQANALFTEARALLDKDDASDEDNTHADELMDKADEKRGEADKLHKDDERRARLDKAIGNRTENEHEREEQTRESNPNEDSDERDLRERRSRAINKWVRQGRAEMTEIEKRDLVEDIDTAGGYLVPEDMRQEIIKELPAFTIMRPRARVMTTGRDVVMAPRLTGATGDDQDIFTSAVQVTWASELMTDDEGEVDPAFGQERIPVNKMIAKTRLSIDFLMDTEHDVIGLLNSLYAEAFGLGEDQAFMDGNGVSRPKGLFQDTDVPTVNSLDANTVTADGLIDLVYGLPSQYRQRGVYFMASDTERDIRKLKDGNGDYLWQPGLQLGQPASLLGFAILSTEFAPAIAAGNDPIAFGDPNTYWIFDRTGLTMQRLDERYAEQGLVGFVATRRVAGQPTQPRAWRFQRSAA